MTDDHSKDSPIDEKNNAESTVLSYITGATKKVDTDDKTTIDLLTASYHALDESLNKHSQLIREVAITDFYNAVTKGENPSHLTENQAQAAVQTLDERESQLFQDIRRIAEADFYNVFGQGGIPSHLTEAQVKAAVQVVNENQKKLLKTIRESAIVALHEITNRGGRSSRLTSTQVHKMVETLAANAKELLKVSADKKQQKKLATGLLERAGIFGKQESKAETKKPEVDPSNSLRHPKSGKK